MEQIIVIEGTDGCGKATQTQRLQESLKKENYSVFTTSFPNYASPSSGPVKLYLQGELGEEADSLSAKQSSILYATDRLCTYKKEMEAYFKDDHSVILLDRYVSSNLLHQGGKILKDTQDYSKLDAFTNWIETLEYEDLQLPRPTLTFFLHLSTETSLQLMENRANKITQDSKKDILESDVTHLKYAEKSGIYLAKKLGWTIIECETEEGLRSIEDIHQEIDHIVKEHLSKIQNEKQKSQESTHRNRNIYITALIAFHLLFPLLFSRILFEPLPQTLVYCFSGILPIIFTVLTGSIYGRFRHIKKQQIANSATWDKIIGSSYLITAVLYLFSGIYICHYYPTHLALGKSFFLGTFFLAIMLILYDIARRSTLLE